MTSFDFVVSCGKCHPGGGPLEQDRDGLRYDERMKDPASGLTSAGDNGLDGDYYRARWSESGVVEADCLICHLRGYDLQQRNAQLGRYNFRWAATAGSGLATVEGSVKGGIPVEVRYDASHFQADGTLRLPMVREPRSETCLGCHAKSDWKKRGASYAARTDVHVASGLHCTDCHTAGSDAADERISGRETHQIGKGDDPGGFVRDDLDGTVRDCASCHADGTLGAPVARHAWLPPLHLDELSCQACHIPWRHAKAALAQASDVHNPGPYITPPGKRIWTFYDAERDYWNHYGENAVFGIEAQPTDRFRPTLARYKGKIYPVNRIHSSFVGLELEGQPGLQQLFMKDFYGMWARHLAAPQEAYPTLGVIVDDDLDGMIEVNRPDEIDALLSSVRAHLEETAFPMQGKRVVYVADSRVYVSGTESRELPRESHEATAYASVFKYSHDVAPARAALGAGGCIDCHGARGDFFTRPVLDRPFGEDGAPVWRPNHELLGLSAAWVRLGELREERIKPALHVLLALVALLAVALGARFALAGPRLVQSAALARWFPWAVVLAGIAGGALVLGVPGLAEYMLFPRRTLDANHFLEALGAVALASALLHAAPSQSGFLRAAQVWLARAGWLVTALIAVFGGLMLFKVEALAATVRFAYTGFDGGLVVLLCLAACSVATRLMAPVQRRGEPEQDGSTATS